MDPVSALFATILTNITMGISDKRKKSRTETRELTVPEKEMLAEDAPGCMLFFMTIVLTLAGSYFIVNITNAKSPISIILIILICSSIAVGLFFWMLFKVYPTENQENPNAPKITIPIKFDYLEYSISSQTARNFPGGLYFYHMNEGANIICDIEEYLCSIGKEIVFDETDLDITEKDKKLIQRIKKLKEDTIEARNNKDMESFKRGFEILEKWLAPYHFESKDELKYYSDINDIAENDIITFGRTTIDMLYYWQKTTMKYLYSHYAIRQNNKDAYDRNYKDFCKFAINDRFFTSIDVILALYSVYSKLGAPRIINITDANIYNRPRSKAFEGKRKSFLYNPKYIEESNY